ncbi:MAG TPA: HD domain-containing protein [Gemmatimonadales bacterium]|nr:HD domain-containing protein [Gemmatimonadales bacterium]
MTPYSDRLSHAFAFAAKYYGRRPPGTNPTAYLAQPAKVAVLLTRYGAEEPTVIAGIMHHVLEESRGGERRELERKVKAKFGPVVLGIALDAVEPRFDARGVERPWRAAKTDYLAQLADACPSALDICVADEIQHCGDMSASLRRLGAEYVREVAHASSEQTMWWYREMFDVLTQRHDWPTRAMLDELRTLSAAMLRTLRPHGDPG